MVNPPKKKRNSIKINAPKDLMFSLRTWYPDFTDSQIIKVVYYNSTIRFKHTTKEDRKIRNELRELAEKRKRRRR